MAERLGVAHWCTAAVMLTAIAGTAGLWKFEPDARGYVDQA